MSNEAKFWLILWGLVALTIANIFWACQWGYTKRIECAFQNGYEEAVTTQQLGVGNWVKSK